ncbi:MAG TPA: dicarboxylate/amino acid:cation symporter [Fimbriimonadaceae bacterium]|nr:dicarboxylate/amino acid:cation symporter [Fimbriimonadaceae bacterium]
MNERRRMPLHTKIFLGLVLGALAGGVVQGTWGPKEPWVVWVRENLANPVGQIFLSLIFMIVVPLLFSALVLGVAEIGDARKVGRIGLRALGMTVVLSGLAVLIGIGAVNIVKPGEGIDPKEREVLLANYKTADAEKKVEDAKKAKTAAETIVEFVPRNPLASAVDALGGGLLPFMVFALIFGIALASIEAEKALPVKEFLGGVFATSLKVIEMAMRLAPYGVFGLVFVTASTLGVSAFVALGKYAGLVLVALAFHLVVIYSLAIRFVAKRDPRRFFGQIRGVMLTAFATASSNATLPAALKSAEEDVGLPRDISSFVLTVGATANQNGTALFEGITIIFLAQFFGVELTVGQQFLVMGLAILAGVGTAGVPGGAWPMIAVILVKIGVPAEAIGICLGIDRVLDMSRTVLNVTGDITIAACVSELERGDRSALATAEGG